MHCAVNTEAYHDVARDFFRLVGLRRDRPDLGLLSKLTRAFGRLPYENVTKIIRAHEQDTPEGRMRFPDIVLAEHLDFGAGGTCFSLTSFFEQVLAWAGYDFFTVLCDRSYGAATHCALVVRLGGDDYLVDPGYLLEAPLLIPPRQGHQGRASVQRTEALTVRLVRLGETSQLLLFTERHGKQKLRYRFRDIPTPEEDFRQRWIDSFDWAMMRHLCVSRMDGGKQLYMRDGVVRQMRRDGQGQTSVREGLAATVASMFGIDPRLVDAARDVLNRKRALAPSDVILKGALAP